MWSIQRSNNINNKKYRIQYINQTITIVILIKSQDQGNSTCIILKDKFRKGTLYWGHAFLGAIIQYTGPKLDRMLFPPFLSAELLGNVFKEQQVAVRSSQSCD